ncbi:RNA polymerase RPO35 [Adoxophyes honmai entomopoxvirus 'L']|uniref:RNA polymerase RPO35 n=1 Tax=Adoxophyes honmai entomopoxvirus 'L' TaxID=1293540 RepID=A0A916KP24_9POXV|nr:RNA polymerase RPO35 [Adoxophyes honmai entomopoxvirus 'L']CCU55372.1 RNA polymerase RPO35 [Adoxophyes honmai entomopoxvirus 'L']
MEFKNVIFSYKFTSIKEKKIYQICKAINNIFDEKITIPTLSKSIIDAKHNLGPIYLNIVNMLAYSDIIYLFNNNLNDLNNCGFYLNIIDDGSKHFLTYKDMVLFIFDDDTGEIKIIENPKYSEKHHILSLSKEKKINDAVGVSHVLCFSSNAKIEENINLHKNILKTFDKYSITHDIKSEIENSKHYYQNNILFKKPFSMWGMCEDNEYTIKIRYNHYSDIDKNNIKLFFTNIFNNIADIFENTKIKHNSLNYVNKINYSNIIKHKMNYECINVLDEVEKNKMDALCEMNDIPGINGIYLKPLTDEIVDGEHALNNIMRQTIKELLDSFLIFIDKEYENLS